jgi:hypothetical protein
MNYVVLESVKADYQRLPESERELFREVLPAFVAACDRYAANPATPWPRSLRVKSVEQAPGIFEMTWSFSGPDGRTTFEWIQLDGAPALRWRRIGFHRILRAP